MSDFITSLDPHKKVLLLLGGLSLPFDDASVVLINPISYGFFRFILLRGGAQRPAGQKSMLDSTNLLEIWYTGRFGSLSQIPNFHVNSIAFSQIMTSSIFEFS